MKKINIIIAGLLVVIASGISKAAGSDIEFDGRATAPAGVHLNYRSVSFEAKAQDMELPGPPEPVLINYDHVNLDHSILSTMNNCEKSMIDSSVVLNLKKLLLLGTKEEKTEFINSPKYIFPHRFAGFDDERFGASLKLSENKGFETHCWEDNCRIEQACGDKKACSRGCELVGVSCAMVGTATTQYYTGGFSPSASAGVGVAAGLGCKWACEDWVCDNIQDCHDVKKCDSHCETIPVSGGGDTYNSNTGQTNHS